MTCGNPTIIDKNNRCSDWAMRDTLFDFVGLIKAAIDSTIKLNFNERTVSDIQKLVGINKTSK